MTETLRKAIDLAQQQPEDEQEIIAQLILQEIQGYTSTRERLGSKTVAPNKDRRVDSLGWSEAEAREVRTSLFSFEEDWNAPGMDAYDEL